MVRHGSNSEQVLSGFARSSHFFLFQPFSNHDVFTIVALLASEDRFSKPVAVESKQTRVI